MAQGVLFGVENLNEKLHNYYRAVPTRKKKWILISPCTLVVFSGVIEIKGTHFPCVTDKKRFKKKKKTNGGEKEPGKR